MKNFKVLVVDDDVQSLKIMEIFLSQFFDSIDIANNGMEAYEKYQKNNYDVIISDLNMPKMSGLELFEKIREKDNEISLILITAFDDLELITKSIEIGVDGYIIKPVDVGMLQKILKKVTQKQKAIKDSKRYLKQLQALQKAVDKIAIVSKTDKRGIITYVNDEFCKISGYSKDELIGKPHSIIRHPDMDSKVFKEMWDKILSKNIWQGIIKNKSKDGRAYYVDSVVMPILDDEGEIEEFIAIRENITSFISPLEKLKDAMKENPDKYLVLVQLHKYDLYEDFYNEEILRLIEDKVHKLLEEKFSTTVYPLGHGGYGFICAKTQKRLKEIQEEIDNMFIDVNEYSFNPEILLSLSKENKHKFENAKIGLRELQKSENKFIIADGLFEKKREIANKNIEMIKRIKSAINEKRIVSYFQPIINNQTKTTEKYESLVRMVEGESVISPYFFLDISKKANLYHQITAMVIENSFETLRLIEKEISINLSSMDISIKYIRDKIISLLKEHKDLANRIVFEILEDEDIKDEKLIVDFISSVKEFGCKIAIDDFGSGYSGFERIFKYKPDIIKIDGFLIKNILEDKYAQSMVKAIVSFAKENNIKTVAEFVEDENMFNKVKELSIDYSQGYYFDKPRGREYICKGS